MAAFELFDPKLIDAAFSVKFAMIYTFRRASGESHTAGTVP